MGHRSRRQDPGAAKRRDMSRSVLPSTARRRARGELSAVRRADRHQMAAKLHAAVVDGCRCEISDECAVCDPHVEFGVTDMLEAVNTRRAFDKVAPLRRWAAAQVDGVDGVDERRAMLSEILPAGVIGEHAMTHVHDIVGDNRMLLWDARRERRRQEFERQMAAERAWLEAFAMFALESGRVAQVHQFLRAFAQEYVHETVADDNMWAVSYDSDFFRELYAIPAGKVRAFRKLVDVTDVQAWVAHHHNLGTFRRMIVAAKRQQWERLTRSFHTAGFTLAPPAPWTV